MKRRALISCEASLNIGTGHVMRCLVMADELSSIGFDITFITSKTSLDLISRLKDFSCVEIENFSKNPLKSDLLIVDNYDLDVSYERNFREYAKIILAIDDLANRRHDCDILLDQNLGAHQGAYFDLVGENCRLLVGTSYCLLRSEFASLRNDAIKKRRLTKSVKKILINFGGSDINNHSLDALKLVENSSFCGDIEVVLGFSAPNFESVYNFAKNSRNNVVIHKSADMAQIIFSADAAIAAGGTSAWERCCLGLPTYIVKIADNQEKIFKELGYNLSFNDFILDLNSNYQSHVDRIVNYVDGFGVKRVVNELIAKL